VNVEIIPRIPLVPGVTAQRENIEQVAEFLFKKGCADYELLSYNSGGIAKRRYLGKSVPALMTDVCPDMDNERECREIYFNAVNANKGTPAEGST
jgi:pyruvate-formate lyase-activating enzyme